LAIDLVWHTHQMFPRHYHAETAAIAGRFINHDGVAERRPLCPQLARPAPTHHSEPPQPGWLKRRFLRLFGRHD
jgi:hypothetical protein